MSFYYQRVCGIGLLSVHAYSESKNAPITLLIYDGGVLMRRITIADIERYGNIIARVKNGVKNPAHSAEVIKRLVDYIDLHYPH